MRAVVFTETGPADVMHVVDRAEPAVHAGEVRVRIIVSGVNPTDVGARSGRGTTDGTNGPHVPGQDGAGIVDAVGAGVTTVRPGDRVWVWDAAWGRSDGTAQELVSLPARQAVRLPDGVSFDVGASLGIPALTAHRALTAAADGPRRLAPGALHGRTVLVTGGAGAVGNAAVQLAVWAGATVVTTVNGKEKAVLARAAGADHVIDYRTEDVAARMIELAGVAPELIVEVDAADNMKLDAELIAPHGTIAIYTPGPHELLGVPAVACLLKNIELQFILTYLSTTAQKDAAVAAVSEAVAARALRVGADAGLPIIRYPLDRVVEAHEAVERHVVGKVLLQLSADRPGHTTPA